MTQSSRKTPDPDDLLRYRFAWAPRGRVRYVAEDAARSESQGAILHISAPLLDFPWDGVGHRLRDDICIISPPSDFPWNDREIVYFLSEEERERAKTAGHWLSLRQPAHDPVSARAKINAFLICLWAIRPTLTHVAMRFEQGPDELRVSRVLDRFQWIKDQLYADLHDEHLHAVRGLLPGILAAYGRRMRLRNALTLTFRGCISTDWQLAFLCFSAALEAMLTCSRQGERSGQLADNYRKLMSRYGVPGDGEADLARLYRIGSDIAHGYGYQRSESSQNLADLTDFSNVLRQLWRMVLADGELRGKLEESDEVRAQFFAVL